MRSILAMALLLLTLIALSPPDARGQGAIQVTNDEVLNRFQEGEILFRLAVRSDSPIQKVILRYKILPDGALTVAEPTFTSGPQVSVTFRLKGNDPPRIYIHPGATVEYYWEVEDASGQAHTTEKATVAYADDRFPWQSAIEGNLTVYWYAGNEAAARSLLTVGRETLDQMSQLLDTQVDFPVKVWVYASPGDMRAAIQGRSPTFEQQVFTAGQRVSSDTVVTTGGGGAPDTLRHELTHIVTKQAGEGPFGDLPAWLDEGTAMYAQGSPGTGFLGALESALDRNRPLSLRSMSSPPGNPSAVNLFYGQAWSVVTYLVETYEPERFAQLFAVFKKGSTVDRALQAVYGFDLAGLEDEWRANLGLAPQPPAVPTPPPLPQPAPRPQPEQAPAPGAQPTAPTGDEGAPVITIAVITALALVVLALATTSSVMLVRRLR
ncbi:MAG: peptidase MA family metallohydrolase [Dehalococcoidia bacterium]